MFLEPCGAGNRDFTQSFGDGKAITLWLPVSHRPTLCCPRAQLGETQVMGTEPGPLCATEASLEGKETSPAAGGPQGSVLLLSPPPSLSSSSCPRPPCLAGSSAPRCHYSTDIWWQLPQQRSCSFQRAPLVPLVPSVGSAPQPWASVGGLRP